MIESTLTPNRPFTIAWMQGINWLWWLQRAPMLLLAAPSAYGVGAFASEHLPIEVAIFAGCAFEAAYIGAIAAADQSHDEEDGMMTVLWWGVNLFAVVCSVLSNLLFFAGGHYADITPEVATHAIPLPVLGFSYGLLLHRTSTLAGRKYAATTKRQQELEEERQLRDLYRCAQCGRGFTSEPALRGHYRTHSK